MFAYACLLLTATVLLSISPASGATFNFSTGSPDGRMAAASRIEGAGLIEIEAADDFITTADQTTITSTSFFGLLPGGASTSNIDQVVIEIYRVFPLDSTFPPDGRVPTRNNSPSDIAFDTRASDADELTFNAVTLGPFTANNSVLNGINPSPGQTTGGEGAVSGTQVRIDVNLTSPFHLPPGHYFYVPQVRLSNGGTFYFLSTTGNSPPVFTGDLQAWIRNANLDPDWLRVGTDIVGGNPAPTFDMTFSLAGTTEAAALVAAALPGSRSVQVGTTATFFMTVINSGTTTANGVDIKLNTGIPATLTFQTTDPKTNLVTGTPNTAVNIDAGKSQSFVVALTPTGAFNPTDVAFAFGGGNAPILSGIDTLLFSASTTPVPDVVAVAATVNNDGIVHLPGNNGNGAFAVATFNLGSGASMTASADTGTATLPVLLFVCQTIPATGACMQPPTPTVNVTIDADATPTFGVFVAGLGFVPFDPAKNRVFFRVKDAGGTVRGETNVAVESQ